MVFALISSILVSLTTGAVCDLDKLIPDPTQVTQMAVTQAALIMFIEYNVVTVVSIG